MHVLPRFCHLAAGVVFCCMYDMHVLPRFCHLAAGICRSYPSRRRRRKAPEESACGKVGWAAMGPATRDLSRSPRGASGCWVSVGVSERGWLIEREYVLYLLAETAIGDR